MSADLHALAERLDALLNHGDPHMDGTTTYPWPKYRDRPGQVMVTVPGHISADLRAAADAVETLARLRAGLADAGLPAVEWAEALEANVRNGVTCGFNVEAQTALAALLRVLAAVGEGE